MVTVLITPPEATPPVGAFLCAVVVFSCMCAVDTFLFAVVWDPPPPPCPSPPAPACPPLPPACPPPQLASQRARRRTRAATQGVRFFNIVSLLSSVRRWVVGCGHRMPPNEVPRTSRSSIHRSAWKVNSQQFGFGA